MRHARAWLLAGLALTLGCSQGPPEPAPLDTAHETCRWCRMTVSDPGFAAQLVAPAEEPRFFDDIGCLRDFLAERESLPEGAVAFVADHRTRSWVPASRAVYTRVASVRTPMDSHLIAHADTSSRDADPAAKGGAPVPAAEIFGPAGPPWSQP